MVNIINLVKSGWLRMVLTYFDYLSSRYKYPLLLTKKGFYLLLLLIFTGTTSIFPGFLPTAAGATANFSISSYNQLLTSDRLSQKEDSNDFSLVQSNSLVSNFQPPEIRVIQTTTVIVTAYSSTPEETDDTPFITASGKWVRDGIIASNLLPFGTKVKLPNLFGDKIFVVEDRMNQRKGNYQIDIWFPSRREALNFGAKTAQMEIVREI